MRSRLLAVLVIVSLAGCHARVPAPTPYSEQGGGAAGLDVARPAMVRISQVQGTAGASAMVGQQVGIQGIVVGNFAAGLGGVFVQSERGDDDPASAEGIFVEHAIDALPVVRVGDRVRAFGRVIERGDAPATLTSLDGTVVEVIGHGTPKAHPLSNPPVDWEPLEGMLLSIRAPLTVSGNDGVATYGEVLASFGGRLFQPTELAQPGAAAERIAKDNSRRQLLLDDNQSIKDPGSPWFLAESLADDNPLRADSELRRVTGVLDQRRGDYRLQLTTKPEVRQAPRPQAPDVKGDVRIVGMNLLNLFNGDGGSDGFPTQRGAETVEQYRRQQEKLVNVVQALKPDIAALMEVENDGSGADSALSQFVAALNSAGPIRDYRAVDTGSGPGSDLIRVAMIYRSGRVVPQGKPAMLEGGPFEKRSRVPLAQAFRVGDGPVFVVAANHFKSKGCGREGDQARGEDADSGQGCWNATRVASARLVHGWLAGDPTGTGAKLHLVIGDLNAYAQEDPLRVLRELGWTDAFAGNLRPYSFVFDGRAGRLDHALLDAEMAARLRGAVEWHNNSDESALFDYHADREGDTWRASDHDPVLLGFDLARQRL